jgi:glycosyltransferase involved in cell wall biosynthesis
MSSRETGSSGEALRVLQLNTLLTGGGTDDQCVKLAAGLHQAGVDVALAGPSGREFSSVVQKLGVTLEDTGAEGFIKLRYIAVVAGIIRRRRIQVVHGHHGRDYWPTILAALLSGRSPRIVLTRHLAKSPGSWPGRWLILSLCDALVACSQFVAKVLREGDADPNSPEEERHWRPPMRGNQRKIRVIYGGFQLERFQPMDLDHPAVSAMRSSWGVRPGEFVFGVVGGFMLPRGKGQREFLAAAALIRERVPQARFLILGRGNMSEVLEQDIVRLGLQGVARLPGYCTDMPAAMNALDCMVHPQIGTEAMPGVVVEAHACGRPVVASALDGIPEAFAMGGLGELVPSENVPALAAALERVALGPALSLEERRRVHDRVASRMSLERYAQETLSLYQELLTNRP